MKIIKLEAENVKRLNAVSIAPDPSGALVIIGGENGQGKTSVLDSIMYAMAGGKAIPKEVLRKGEKKGHVTVNVGEYEVTRTFTESGGGSVTVKTAAGVPVKSPQTMLDGLVGSLSFDPLEFMSSKPVEQMATLRRLVGIDFSELENKRAVAYETRTVCNREVKRLEGTLATMPKHGDVPDKPLDPGAIMAEINTAQELERQNNERQRRLFDAKADVSRFDAEIAELSNRLKSLMDRKANATAALEALELEPPIAVPNMIELRNKLNDVQNINNKVRANHDRAKIEAQLEEAQGESAAMSLAIDAVDEQKQAILAAAKFPVAGLSFGEDGVVLNGLPLENASSAEGMRVSVAVGAAMNPKLKVLLVRDGSLMDDKSMALLAEIAEEYDCQVWVERVGDKDQSAIIIEDGAVRE